MPSKEKEKKFYAVKVGRVPGVYNTWTECQNQCSGFPGNVFRSFTTSEEAQKFIGQEESTVIDTEKSSFEQVANDWAAKNNNKSIERESESVYVGGVCKKDKDSKLIVGGYGVWFSDTDPRNIKESFKLPNPTNQRCSLMATIRAMEIMNETNKEADITLCTHSEYIFLSLARWIYKWVKNDFKGVANQGLIKKLYDLIQQRQSAVFIYYSKENFSTL